MERKEPTISRILNALERKEKIIDIILIVVAIITGLSLSVVCVWHLEGKDIFSESTQENATTTASTAGSSPSPTAQEYQDGYQDGYDAGFTIGYSAGQNGHAS